MPTENGLPEYVSRYKNGILRYYRRPASGVTGSAFVRSFKTKDRKAMMTAYGPVHIEAEAYFAKLISGRTFSDSDLKTMMLKQHIINDLFKQKNVYQAIPDLGGFIDEFGTDEMRALAGPDRERMCVILWSMYAGTETGHLELARMEVEDQDEAFRGRFNTIPTPANAFTLKDAYEDAWKPAKDRGKNTVVEVGRYVDEFETLNGKLDLKDYDRSHWAAWRKDCLDKHGPGATAFKRFSMMKTVVAEAIRAGLFERKNFTGQDVSMSKPKRNKLRNEGWLEDELTEFFAAPVFRGAKDMPHADADYWVAAILAHIGARLSEVVGMSVADVAKRHGFWTFYLAKETGKTEDSRRIIPIPKRLIDLGLLKYLETRPKSGPLFEGVNAKLMSQTYSRMRADLGITRKGADAHAWRHHMRTLLRDLHCPDQVADYITGHTPPGVSGTYGKTQFATALRFLDQVDLGVTIPIWKPTGK